jgi:hypothetical protein
MRYAGRVIVRESGSAADLLALDEPFVMNCTDLGAKELTGDTQLEPISGQLSVLAPQRAIDYVTLHGGHYMLPDGIILGGTFQHGNADLQPNAATEAEVVADQAAFLSAMHAQTRASIQSAAPAASTSPPGSLKSS